MRTGSKDAVCSSQKLQCILSCLSCVQAARMLSAPLKNCNASFPVCHAYRQQGCCLLLSKTTMHPFLFVMRTGSKDAVCSSQKLQCILSCLSCVQAARMLSAPLKNYNASFPVCHAYRQQGCCLLLSKTTMHPFLFVMRTGSKDAVCSSQKLQCILSCLSCVQAARMLSSQKLQCILSCLSCVQAARVLSAPLKNYNASFPVCHAYRQQGCCLLLSKTTMHPFLFVMRTGSKDAVCSSQKLQCILSCLSCVQAARMLSAPLKNYNASFPVCHAYRQQGCCLLLSKTTMHPFLFVMRTGSKDAVCSSQKLQCILSCLSCVQATRMLSAPLKNYNASFPVCHAYRQQGYCEWGSLIWSIFC